MSILSSVLVPGVVAAGVTLLFYWWIQRPRADLQMVKIYETVEVTKWLARARKDPDAEEAMKRQARDIVLLTNYGDGIAFDIKLSGTNCIPRVYVRDVGEMKDAEVGETKDAEVGETKDAEVGETKDAEVVAKWPMWSDRLGALKPGEMMSVVVMSDPALKERPVLEVSWPRLPRRLPKCLIHTRLGSITVPYPLATARIIESGWPGKTDIASAEDESN